MSLIRLAELSDAIELQRLNDLFNGENCNSLEGIARSLANNKHELVCVADNGEILIGFCCAQIGKSMCYPMTFAEITELFVQEQYRSQGYGRQLLQFMELQLDQLDVRHYHILTNMSNHIAKELYRSSGYVETDEILLDKNT